MEPNFNLNRPPISDEEINSKKDFGELVNKFKKQSIEKARSDVNFFKKKKVTYSAIIAGVAVICTITYFSVFKKNPPKETSNDKITTIQHQHTNFKNTRLNKAFIAPPIAKLNIPYTAYKINAEQGGTITHKTHSKIIVPKKAFINKQGQDIVGDVEIRYREFHNQADIIVSGIPMTYDSAGIKTHLESAGMIDIRGYQNNEPIFIKPNKTITVEFESEHTADKYNMYVLDTVARNWVYTGRDNSLKRPDGDKEIKGLKRQKEQEVVESPKTKELQKQIDAIPPKIENEKIGYEKKIKQLPKVIAPLKPTKATSGRQQFQLDVNYKEFPELEAFKNAMFEVGTENKNYTADFAKITWTSAEITEGPQKGKNYLLILTQINRVEKLVVYPALTGANYDNALKSYEAKFNDYKNLATKREANEKKLKEEFEERQAKFIAENKKLYEELTKERIRLDRAQEQRQNEQMASFTNSQKVTRIFQISSFGICNSDCPAKMPREAKMNPVFLVNNGASFITPGAVYLVCHTKNLVYNFSYEPISYNPREEYTVCVMSKGKLFICDKVTFNKCIAANQNKIPVKEFGDDANDAHDLKIALGI